MQSSIRAEPMVSTKQTSRPRPAERFIASRARWRGPPLRLTRPWRSSTALVL